MKGGYLGRIAAASIILDAAFAATAGTPAAGDNVNDAIAKLLGLINAGEDLSFATVASAAGTTTLTVNSSARQELTGVTTQSYVLPVATTLTLYQTFVFMNRSTGTATIKYADASTLTTAVANTYTIVICTSIGTSNGVWSVVQMPILASGIVPNALTSAVAAPTASTLILRDANANFAANNIAQGFATTATAAGTTTLLANSAARQEFTGVTTQDCVLPDATTLLVNTTFEIINNSTGAVTIKYDDDSTALVLPGAHIAIVRCTNIGTTNGTWVVTYAAIETSGTWTPTDGSAVPLSFTVHYANYTKIGKLVYVAAYLEYPATADGTAASIAGLPFPVSPQFACIPITTGAAVIVQARATNSEIALFTTGGANVTNAQMTATFAVINGVYTTS